MKFKNKTKEMLGLIRAKTFCITYGHGVYIGKQCRIQGKYHVTVEDFITIHPLCSNLGWGERYNKNW